MKFIGWFYNFGQYFRLCSKHRKSIASTVEVDTYSHPSNTALDPSYEIDDNRDSVNRILLEVGLSPIKSQTGKALKQQSKSGVRRILSKFQRGIQVFQSKNQ